MPPDSGCAHLHAEAEIVKPGDQAVRELSLVAAVEVVGAEVTIFHAVSQNMVGGGEDRGRDGDNCLFGSAPAAEPDKLRSEIAAVVMADGAPGGLDEGRLEPAVAVASAGRASLAGTLVQAWAESRPGDEVTGRGEVAHVDADLGDQDMGGRVADAPDGGQAGEGGTKGAQRVLQARLELTHGGVECIDLAQVQGEHEAVGEEVGDPGGVVDVGLAPRDVADVHGVGEDELKAALEHVPDGLPVDAGGLHRHVGAALGGEPIAQRQQVASGGPEGLHLTGDLGPSPDARAGDDAVLVHVKSGALGMNDVHAGLLRRVAAPAWSPRGRKLESALSGRRPVVAVRGARRAPGPTTIRVLGTIARPTSVPAPACESTAPRLSCDVGPRSGWEAGLQ